MKVFTNDTDTVVAEDLADVPAAWESSHGVSFVGEGGDIDEWRQVDDDKPITIRNVHDRGWDDVETRTALGRCKFSPGSTAKRFAYHVSSWALHDPHRQLSIKASAYLDHLAHSYRRQIGKCMALDCRECVAPELPAPSNTVERFASAKVDIGWCNRFMALEGDVDSVTGEFVYVPYGGRSPSTFKTLRNARKAAGEDGFVVVFAPWMLPVIADEATHDAVDFSNDIDEESFAERQLLYWERELAAIRSRKS